MARAAFLNAWTRGWQVRSVGEKRWDDPARKDDPWRKAWISDMCVALQVVEDALSEKSHGVSHEKSHGAQKNGRERR